MLRGLCNCSYAEGLSFGSLWDTAAFFGRQIFKGQFGLSDLLPAPGAGPSTLFMADGSGRVEVVASAGAASARTVVDFAGDATSTMLAEAGLCLALAACHEEAGSRGGVTTPAAGTGVGLIRRLEKARHGRFMSFSTTHV